MGEVKGPLVSFRTIQYQSITISIFQYILPRPPLPLPSTPPPSYFSPPPPPPYCSCSYIPYSTSLSILLPSRPFILPQLFPLRYLVVNISFFSSLDPGPALHAPLLTDMPLHLYPFLFISFADCCCPFPHSSSPPPSPLSITSPCLSLPL